jgi:hypothetical protein
VVRHTLGHGFQGAAVKLDCIFGIVKLSRMIGIVHSRKGEESKLECRVRVADALPNLSKNRGEVGGEILARPSVSNGISGSARRWASFG